MAEKSLIGCDAFPALSTLLLLLSDVMLERITVAESEAGFCVVRSLALRVVAERGACSSDTGPEPCVSAYTCYLLRFTAETLCY